MKIRSCIPYKEQEIPIKRGKAAKCCKNCRHLGKNFCWADDLRIIPDDGGGVAPCKYQHWIAYGYQAE